jgi:hypothetical protein
MLRAFAIVFTAAAWVAGAGWGATLEIALRHTFHGELLLLDSLRYQNAAGETLSVTWLSYLLSGFAVEREDGVWVEVPDRYAWMDAAMRRTVVRFDGLHWTWQTGYIFLAVEGHYRTGSSELKGYAHHLARDPHRTRISLAAGSLPRRCGAARLRSRQPAQRAPSARV